jgi:hypothetical protein
MGNITGVTGRFNEPAKSSGGTGNAAADADPATKTVKDAEEAPKNDRAKDSKGAEVLPKVVADPLRGMALQAHRGSSGFDGRDGDNSKKKRRGGEDRRTGSAAGASSDKREEDIEEAEGQADED